MALVCEAGRKARAPLYARQRLMLALLDALGGSVHRTDFQKLLFLYCQETDGTALYDFVPYRFGAFSFTSYADRRRLQDRGLLADDTDWLLTEKGRRVARPERDVSVDDFVARHPLRGDALVAESYRRFPYYATRSEIVNRVLSADDPARQHVALAQPLGRSGGLWTIGYQGRSLEDYLNALHREGVTLLCDVRRNPVSRKYGFSLRTLADSCNGVGVSYEHLPDLGIPTTQRRGLNSEDDYDALFADYRLRSLPSQTADLNRIADWLRAGSRVALTCYERLPEQCHRHCVADALGDLMGAELVVTHL